MDKDILDCVLDKVGELFILLITTILDCIESAFDCMIYRKGKSLLPVLLITWSFLPVTFLSMLFSVGFIHPLDSLVAGIFMTIIYSINNITKFQIEDSVIFALDVVSDIEHKIIKKGEVSKDVK